MAALSFLSMYALMYMMVDRLEHVYMNLNQVYMAGMMTAPMVFFEILLMGSMYPSKPANAALLVVSAVAAVMFIAAIRTQSGVGDQQFLRSMIPHHAGAILMCERAPVDDAEIQALCRSIVADQQDEIDWMSARLSRP